MWTERTFVILGTPSQLAALALEVDRDERTGAEWWPLWAQHGRLVAGLFHVYGWPMAGPAVMIRVNADASNYGPDFWEPDLCIVRHGWIDARSLPGTPERTKARVWLPWGTDDGRAVEWAWGKLYEALVAADLIVKDEETTAPAQAAKRRRPKLTDGESDDLPVELRQKRLRQWLKFIYIHGLSKRAAARQVWPEANADSAVKKLDRWATFWPEVVEDEKVKSKTK